METALVATAALLGVALGWFFGVAYGVKRENDRWHGHLRTVEKLRDGGYLR